MKILLSDYLCGRFIALEFRIPKSNCLFMTFLTAFFLSARGSKPVTCLEILKYLEAVINSLHKFFVMVSGPNKHIVGD